MDRVQVTLDPDDYQQFGECLDGGGGGTLSKTDADLKRFDLQLNFSSDLTPKEKWWLLSHNHPSIWFLNMMNSTKQSQIVK